jgi:quercetin dioxygenase-like cupin family protein
VSFTGLKGNKMNLKDMLVLSDDKPATHSLRKSDKGQVMAIGLKKQQVLKRHITATPAILVVCKGLLAFEMEGSTKRLAQFDTFNIPALIPHEVTALEESIFLVIKEKE